MKKLLMFGLAVIIGLSAGPAMAVKISTGTGEVLFYDDFEGPAPGGVPDNGDYPGEWATFPGPWGAVIYSESGDATIQNSNPFRGNQQMRRENLTGDSNPVNGPTIGVFESVVDSGTIHFEAMFSWAPGGNRLTESIWLSPAEVPVNAGPWDAGVVSMSFSTLTNEMVMGNTDASVLHYGWNTFEFDSGDYHKFEIDHTIGTSVYTFTVTDMVNDPGNPVSETVDLIYPSTNFGHVGFRQGNDFLSVDWDDAGPCCDDDADFDDDGDADGQDFIIWQQGNGIMGSATNADGDANNDTNVDGLDRAVWEDQFGRTDIPTSQGFTGVVPEPSSVLLLIIGIASCMRQRGMRQRASAGSAIA